MKVVFLSHDASLTGAPRALLTIVRRLDRDRFSPVVVLGKDGPLRKEFERVAEVRIQPLFADGRPFIREIAQLRRRFNLIRELSPDLLYCNTIMSSKWILYGRVMRVPTVLHVHELGSTFTILPWIDRFILRSLPNLIIAASEAVKNYLQSAEGVPHGKIVKFNECIDPSAYTQSDSRDLRARLFPDADVIVGTVGRVSRFKGMDTFIEVARFIQSSTRLKVGFLIVGGVEENDRQFYDELLKSVRTAGLEEVLHVTGAQADVLPYFSMLDIFTLCSREDPFPLVNLEAMSLAIPVVCFDAGGSSEAIGESAGMLVEPFSAHAMAAAVLSLINNPNLRVEMGAKGRERVVELFNIHRNITALEQVLTTFSRVER